MDKKIALCGMAVCAAGLALTGKVSDMDKQNPQEDPLAGMYALACTIGTAAFAKKLYDATHQTEDNAQKKDPKTFDATSMFLNQKQKSM